MTEWKVPAHMTRQDERIEQLEARVAELEAELAKVKKIRDGYMLKNVEARKGIKRLISVFDNGGDVHDLAHVIETELRPLVEVDDDRKDPD